ncbi:MAG: helix-turn-helix domain-containing protein, partial [Alphaproteobacteria bacterium]
TGVADETRRLTLDEAKRNLARTLRRLMDGRGWNQAELARQAELHMPPGTTFGRDAANRYYNGRSLPAHLHLYALAKALGVDPAALVPSAHADFLPSRSGVDDVAVSAAPGGKAWLRIDMKVDWPTALKIMEMLKGQDS